MEEKNNPNLKKRVFLIIGMMLFLVSGLSLYGWQKLVALAEEETGPRSEALIINESMAEESPAAPDEQALLASESFRINSLNIGGSIMMIPNDENQALQISNVRSDSFLNGKQGEVKLVIAWQTSKLAVSEIEYSKRDGKNAKMAKESSYGFNHSAVLTGLEPGTPYIYRIRCKDRWGNEEESGYFGMYAPQETVSIFSLIASEVDKMFGWALQ